MARPIKKGLEYYPRPVNFFSQIEIRKLIRRHKGSSVCIYNCICDLIFENCYYLNWNEDLAFIIEERTGLEESYILEVLGTCIDLELFDKELFQGFNILSSPEIQMQYNLIGEQSKRINRVEEYNLLVSSEETNVNTEETNINTEETQVGSGFSTQSKGKESKGKESIEKESIEKEKKENEIIKHSENEIQRFLGFQEWISKNAPQVSKMKNPFTINEYLDLKEYDMDKLKDIILSMENRADLLSKYTSANLTATRWYNNNEGKTSTQGTSNITSKIKDKLKSKPPPLLTANMIERMAYGK